MSLKILVYSRTNKCKDFFCRNNYFNSFYIYNLGKFQWKIEFIWIVFFGSSPG